MELTDVIKALNHGKLVVLEQDEVGTIKVLGICDYGVETLEAMIKRLGVSENTFSVAVIGGSLRHFECMQEEDLRHCGCAKMELPSRYPD